MSGENISLYFGLKDDKTADLEIISSAAIAWVETLRALAQSVDPDSDVRVSLVDVEQGSAVYNTVIDWFDRKIEPQLERVAKGLEKSPPRSRKLVIGLAVFTITTAIPTYQAYFGDGFSDEDRERMKRIEQQTKNSAAVETARQKFFRAVEREPAIKTIEIKEDAKSEPIIVIKSEEFPASGGLFSIQSEINQERITQTVIEVVLVKPALVHTPRAWTFKQDGLPEFDAVMRDGKVLQAIQDKGFPEKMREGIRMTIRLEAKEELVDGQWRLVRGGRSIMRVISPKLD